MPQDYFEKITKNYGGLELIVTRKDEVGVVAVWQQNSNEEREKRVK